MNKFIYLKASTPEIYTKMLGRLRNIALHTLPAWPSRIILKLYPKTLSFFCSFSTDDSGGWAKQYSYLDDHSFFALDGMPYGPGISTDQRLAKSFKEKYLSTADKDTFLESTFGTWAMGYYKQGNGFSGLSDFTGMTPLFLWKDHRVVAIGTRQLLLSAICRGGHSIRISKKGLSWLTGQSTLIGTNLVFQNLSLIPPASTVTIPDKPSQLDVKIDTKEYWTEERYQNDSISEREGDAIAEALVNQANHLSSLPLKSLVIDITGGLDSRLVAALAAHSPMGNQVEALRTAGPEDGREVEVGKSVADYLKYPHRRQAHGASRPAIDVSKSLDSIRYHCFHYEGSITPTDGQSPPGNLSGMQLTGSAGEILRRHNKRHIKMTFNSRQHALDEIVFYAQPNDPLGIQRQSVSQWQKQDMQEIAGKLCDEGAAFNDLTDIFFLRYRLPLWNGIMMNNIYRMVRLYPLINYKVAKIAFSKSFKLRVSDRYHYEAIRRIDPKLCAMPFLDYQWNEDIGLDARKWGVRVATEPYTTSNKPSLVQINPFAVRVIEAGFETMRDIILSNPDSGIFDIHNRRRVDSMLQSKDMFLKKITFAKEFFSLFYQQTLLTSNYIHKYEGKTGLTPILQTSDAEKIFRAVPLKPAFWSAKQLHFSL